MFDRLNAWLEQFQDWTLLAIVVIVLLLILITDRVKE
jgi:hypothetical protein